MFPGWEISTKLARNVYALRVAVCMAHEIAKLMLEHAGTFLERAEAVETALYLGMPLRDAEEYLDWLDMMDAQRDTGAAGEYPFSGSRRRPTAG